MPELQARIDSFSVDMGFGTIPLIESESPVLDGLRALAQHSTDA
jgi:type III pantothenate kinase